MGEAEDRMKEYIAITIDTEPADFEAWLQAGMRKGWIGPPVCTSHDGLPTSAEEDAGYDEGADPCVHVLRLYADAETKAAVEANHAPSVWRAEQRPIS